MTSISNIVSRMQRLSVHHGVRVAAFGRANLSSVAAAAATSDQSNPVEIACLTLQQRAPVIRGPLQRWEVEYEDLHARRLGKKSMLEGLPADREHPVPEWADSVIQGKLDACAVPVQGDDGKFTYSKNDLYATTVETSVAKDSEIEWGMHVDDGGKEADDDQSKEKKLEAFVPLHPLTDADRADDRQSLNRKLDKTLYLVVKCDNYNVPSDQWTLPQTTREGNEPMLEAAERAVSDLVDPSKRLPFDFVTGAPWTHFESEGGAPLSFVYRAELMRRSFNLPKHLRSNVVDHAWVSIDEFGDYFDLSNPKNQRLQKLLWVGT